MSSDYYGGIAGEMADTGRVKQAEDDWPYDAIRDDPLTALRIAVVSNTRELAGEGNDHG